MVLLWWVERTNEFLQPFPTEKKSRRDLKELDTAELEGPPNSENNSFKSSGDLKTCFLSPINHLLLTYCFTLLFSTPCWFADLSTVSVKAWALQTNFIFSPLGFVLSVLLLMARCPCGSQVAWLIPGGSTPDLATWLCLQQQMGEKGTQIPLSLSAVSHVVCSFVAGDSIPWTRKQHSCS